MKNYIKHIFIFCIIFTGTYLTGAFILQKFFIGEEKNIDPEKKVIYVSSGLIHTEFIFPASNSLFQWKNVIPINTVTTIIHDPLYISIGWGSKDFFFNMKTWKEIKWDVLIKAIFFSGESAMHVEYLKEINNSQEIYPLYLTDDEYLTIVSFVKSYFLLDPKGKIQKISEFSYYGTDKFFKAHHNYHMFNTCNMWTKNGLETINAKRPLWTPFKYGIENAMQKP